MRIRPAVSKDYRYLYEIHRFCYREPVNEQEFTSILEMGRTNTIVVVDGRHIPGFVAFTMERKKIVINDLCVSPEYRRMGVGTLLMNQLKNKLSTDRRPEIEVVVAETLLGAHLFLQKHRFIADSNILRNHCASGVDAYRFQFFCLGKAA